MTAKLTFVDREWTQQPQQIVGLNIANPLSRNCVLAVNFGTLHDAVNNRLGTPTAGVTKRTTRYGIGAYCSGGEHVAFKVPAAIGSVPPGATVFVQFVLVNQIDYGAIYRKQADPFSLSASLGSGGAVNYRSINGVSGIGQLSPPSVASIGKLCSLAYVVSENNSEYIFMDGVTGEFGSVAAGSNSDGVLCFGLGGGGYNHPDIIYLNAFVFPNGKTVGELLQLSKNPWGLFEPEQVPLFTPTGTGPVTHPTSGDVVGDTATVTGSALRETTVQTHPSTGAVVGNTATVSGTALRYRAHATTGAVTGLTSNITGITNRYRLHTTTGAATGLTSTVTGSATIQPAPGIHVTSGDVVAGVGTVTGSARHVGVHTTTGVLAGFSAEVVGAAQRSGAVIVHDTSGVLAGYDSVVTGAATNQGSMTLTPADIQAIVAAIKAEIMPVNIVRVNNIDVDGTGADSDPWGPV